LDNHKEANMNAVLWQVRQSGTAYYDSPYEPWGSYLGYKDPGYDPLEYAIQEAHKRGIEIHAWFNAFNTNSARLGTPVAEHPEWVCRDANGNPMPDDFCLSPGLSAVREYTRDVALDIVNRYDIDGLHFDYVRWNEYSSKTVSLGGEEPFDGNFSPEIFEGMEKGSRYLYDIEHPYSAGVPDSLPGVSYSSWESYWRHSVDQFVQMVHDSVQQVKPWVRVSAAALGRYKKWTGYYTVYQDAAKWFNEGWVDQLTPMHYHWTTGSGFVSALTTDWEPEIQEGIAAGRLYTVGPGSYNLGSAWNNHPSIVNACRTLPWVDGFQFFSYGSWQDMLYWEEAGETFFSRQTRIRPITFIPSEAPTFTPEINISHDESYTITATLPSNVENPHWLVLYRSEDALVDPDTDEIISMTFGDSLTAIQVFDGTQLFSGKYTYYACAYNRFWKGSLPSTTVETDLIVSYPPKILLCNVENDDTVSINTKIELEFSKRMDPDIFANHVIFEPETPPLSFIWDRLNWVSGGRKVTISFASNLDNDVTYTLTLTGEVADAAGMPLDGNGDGVGGDAWQIQFHTDLRDETPPELISTFPSGYLPLIDITEPVAFYFDERLDPASVSPERITIVTDGMSISKDAVLTPYKNGTVLSVRSYSRLVSDAPVTFTLASGVSDTVGNGIDEAISLTCQTKNYYYHEYKLLENFMGEGDWKEPTYSGSTVGVVPLTTTFTKSSADNYLPASALDPAQKLSGRLTYEWDLESTEGWFLREHIAGGPPTQVSIDTTWTLQAFVFGDSSMNLIRFSLYETGGDAIAEVSLWDTLNWLGWKLLEWDLWDPNQLGEWEGVALGTMDGTSYRLESVQLIRTDESAVSGTIWIDDIRLVKRTPGQAPSNLPPVVQSIPDTSVEQGKSLRLLIYFEDPNPEDTHQIICESDTTDVWFRIMGHTSGERVYIRTSETFVGQTNIRIIVRDFGVGELADTTEFVLTVTPSTAVTPLGIPTEFALYGNYPNPFNPITTIRYDIPEQTHVMLSLFDIRGAHLVDLVNSIQPPGIYEVSFDGSRYASGIYLMRMQAGDFSAVRRMILLK
ncbi:MAG: family 10 glycosylhydrolase, partial [Candidatus Marinimicrobia bacterium]|nr:family 10 glycosylhydrolase [Candidatus Neomarinimicrobiota bacterium]